MKEHLLANMKNSEWQEKVLDGEGRHVSVGDGRVHNYFKYPERGILKNPWPKEKFMCKTVWIPGYKEDELIETLHQLGIERIILSKHMIAIAGVARLTTYIWYM